jgi:hypothetical protein
VIYTDKGAEVSACGLYRYLLWRTWDDGPKVMFVGLNPSTADASLDDPTIRKCVTFARHWGYGGLLMANLFAFRATQPADMLKAADPVGPRNDEFLRLGARMSSLIVGAWGNGGGHMGRSAVMHQTFPAMKVLRLNGTGHPAHPLYLPGCLTPRQWVAP